MAVDIVPVDIGPILMTLIPTAVGGFGAIWGIYTYRKGQTLKRKEILFPLISELDKSKKMFVAKAIFDDFTCNIPDYVTKESEWEKIIHEDFQHPERLKKYYNMGNLPDILRQHVEDREVTDPREIIVRASFDAMIKFYGKIEYLRNIGLLNDQDIQYFKYYYNKLVCTPAVRNYVRRYRLPLKGSLFGKPAITDHK
jgi:hypothetical protein